MSKLFSPLQVGDCRLQHRLAMAPLTRYRADNSWVPTQLMKEYYIQRACVPGTLIITEATALSIQLVGRDNVPGIWNEAQIQGWKEIIDAVHERGCFIWCQLWAQGRAADSKVHSRLGFQMTAPSAISRDSNSEVPVAMSEEEIEATIEAYGQAAVNAIKKAGFDGVEVHGGNGYLPDQFLQDVSNQRTDKWGGSIENRARFTIEVIKSICSAVGADKAALRLSPWSDFNGMGMPDSVCIPQFLYVLEQLKPMNLAFIDLIEARVRGNDDADCGTGKDVSFMVNAWGKTSPIFLSGGFNPESARRAVDETYKDYNVAILFGRYWTSNPDLVYRIEKKIAFQKYDRSTFYTPSKKEGYVDWAFSDTFVQA